MKNCAGMKTYNCFGEIAEWMCYECMHNEKSKAPVKANNYVTQVTAVTEFYDFLTGKQLPEGVHCEMPELSAELAYSVIWFLQEITGVLPTNIEQCCRCKHLYDSDSEGDHFDNENQLFELDENDNEICVGLLPEEYHGFFCDACVPNIRVG